MSSNIVLMIAGIIRMRVLIERGPYMRKYGAYCQLGFSSEIEVAELGSARAGKFRLGLITRNYLLFLLALQMFVLSAGPA